MVSQFVVPACLYGQFSHLKDTDGFWHTCSCWASLVAQTVKCLPTMRETRVRSLGQEDPLEKEMQHTPVFLTGKSHGLRILVGYSPWGRKESDITEWLHFTSLQLLGVTKQKERDLDNHKGLRGVQVGLTNRVYLFTQDQYVKTLRGGLIGDCFFWCPKPTQRVKNN